ncbi:MAG: NAD(P)/FAD-dependent oxidoreductase, partial [Clostridia bacterium]|nr:NAD(P)/FAD-dependent oxidoreductase [Clostridia bacterium]
MQADVGIIGGGASGIAAAIAAGRGGERVLLLESMEQIGKKLLATGNGRCNLINSGKPVYYGDPEFAALVTGSNPVDELTAFWHSLGLFLRYDREGRGYPFTGMASTVVEVLKAEMK